MAYKHKTFRNQLSETIFHQKYAHDGCETWEALCRTLAQQVVGPYFPKDVVDAVAEVMVEQKFLAGGRYLYYAGRPVKFFNNCYLLRAEEDTREDWADLSWKSESCLLTGGGIGIDYSIYRDSSKIIKRTGGKASGPIPKMLMVNEIGRRIMQGGSRRSAIYASLNWKHGDIESFLRTKNWHEQKIPGTDVTLWDVKNTDFNFPAPLDMTNISVNYDTEWLLKSYKGDLGDVFLKNVEQALTTGEPGFSFNFFDKENETLRNACTEVTSEDDSDVCNLGSLNFSRINSISDLQRTTELATIFLLCGTLEADLPYRKIAEVRQKNRRLGLGIMGLHEWLLARGYKYEVTPELHQWLSIYKGVSDDTSKRYADRLGISRPVANRAIAPTG